MGDVPITREFLREHYKGYPAPALTPGFVESSEQVERLLGVLCSQVGGADKIRADREIRAPKRIDENLFRNREQCEEIEHVVRAESLEALRASLAGRSAPESSVNEVVNNMQQIGEVYHQIYEKVESYQTNNVARIEREVAKKLPNDWRMRMVKSKRDKKEAKFKAEMEDMMAGGASIKEKYDVLWRQQMKRREQLVNLGNASGVFKWILKTLGGVPQVMLDFVKTINDEQGPLEETRIMYAPNLIAQLMHANRVHVCTAVLMLCSDSVPLDGEHNIVDVSKTLVRGATENLAMTSEYLAFMATLMENSPFFLTKSDALASSVSSSADSPMKELVVHSREVVDIPIVTKEDNVELVYEFTTQKHDVGFAIRHHRTEETFVEVLPLKRYEADKESVSGEITLASKGKYTVVFDNSFSMFTKKVVSYRLIVLAPSADQPEESGDAPSPSGSASTSGSTSS